VRLALRTRARIDSLAPEFRTRRASSTWARPSRLPAVRNILPQAGGEHAGHPSRRQPGTILEFFVTEPLETLIRKRASFIVNRQQVRDPAMWDGVFAPFDMKNNALRTIEDRTSSPAAWSTC